MAAIPTFEEKREIDNGYMPRRRRPSRPSDVNVILLLSLQEAILAVFSSVSADPGLCSALLKCRARSVEPSLSTQMHSHVGRHWASSSGMRRRPFLCISSAGETPEGMLEVEECKSARRSLRRVTAYLPMCSPDFLFPAAFPRGVTLSPRCFFYEFVRARIFGGSGA